MVVDDLDIVHAQIAGACDMRHATKAARFFCARPP